MTTGPFDWIVVDGNDGTGKTALVRVLRERGFDVQDRGEPTLLTDMPNAPLRPNSLYLILDVPVEISRERLATAKKSLTERYHTVEDLTYYRARYREIAAQLPNCELIDASGPFISTLNAALDALRRRGVA